MRYQETTARRCRYGDVAERIFGEADIIWEHSEDDCQGFANILAAMPDGRIAHYEWTYGSSAGCDEWEERELDDDQIEEEMRRHVAFLPDVEAARRYFKLEAEYAGAKVPTANSDTNGSFPGMCRYIFGEIGDDFSAAGQVFETWLAKRCGAVEEKTKDTP